jgi:LPXTG-site transpeptidase (sortase) family protein
MQSKFKLIITLLSLVIFATLLYAIPKIYLNSLAFEQATPLPTSEKVIYGMPLRLKIPILAIDSAIEYVGLTSSGDMDVPKYPGNVGWFQLGPKPGEKGNAVIDGHYGIKNGRPSVFDNLHTLRVGDRLYVEDDKGTMISFIVRESRRYDPEANASDVFIPHDGKAHLNLITCEGVWNNLTKSYSSRLVIFTDRE